MSLNVQKLDNTKLNKKTYKQTLRYLYRASHSSIITCTDIFLFHLFSKRHRQEVRKGL